MTLKVKIKVEFTIEVEEDSFSHLGDNPTIEEIVNDIKNDLDNDEVSIDELVSGYPVTYTIEAVKENQ